MTGYPACKAFLKLFVHKWFYTTDCGRASGRGLSKTSQRFGVFFAVPLTLGEPIYSIRRINDCCNNEREGVQ
jgi:hypothetical protein